MPILSGFLLGILLAVLIFSGGKRRRKLHGNQTATPDPKNLSRQEALEILGLSSQDLTEASVKEAYNRLIKKLHPDQGGSSYLTRQVTAARDLLKKELSENKSHKKKKKGN